MTVMDQFHNWGTFPREPDPKRCSPLLVTLRHYLLDRWGGMYLGCYSRRTIIGGTTLSSHASGAALDWRYADPGPGRAVLLDTILPWLLNNSLELGVDAVHDYIGQRVWRPPGTSGRPSGPVEVGWRSGNYQVGEWIHVEVVDTRWADTRSVDQMLGTAPPIPPPPIELGDKENEMWIVAKEPNQGAWRASPRIRGGQYHVPNDVPAAYVFADSPNGRAYDLKTGGQVSDWGDVGEVSTADITRYMGAKVS